MSDKFEVYQKAIARIWDSDGRIWGAGFLVSENYLFTCAHVIIRALGLNQESFLETPQGLISLDFPNCPTQPKRQARVAIWKPCPEFFSTELLDARAGEDIALLQLDRPFSPDEVKFVQLTPADNLWGREFRVYGFPSSSNLGLSTTGKLRSLQGRRWIQLKVDANEPPIEGGFSGAPLWDATVEGVIGMMIAAEEYDPQGNRAREVSFMIPSSILQKIWLRQGRLLELLKSFDESFKPAIRRAYHACRPPEWNGEQPTTLVEIVIDLNDLDERYSARREDSPLVKFAARLANCREMTNALRQKLQTWVELTFELNGDEFAERCDRVSNNPIGPQEQVPQHSLQIAIADREVKGRYQLEAWLIKNVNSSRPSQTEERLQDNSSYSSTQLEQLERMPQSIHNLLDRVLNEIEGELDLEVFVPFELLHLAPDTWKYEMDWEEPQPIGYYYPVVLRVWDRLGYKKPYKTVFISKWKQRWERQEWYRSYCCSQVLVCSDRADDEIDADWIQEFAIGLRKTKTPKVGKGGLFSFLMREGVPIALWLRQDLETCCSAEKYQDLLNAPLSELPQKLKNLRKAPRDRNTHIGHHLSLLWDNPDQVPTDAPLFSNASL